MDGFIAQLVEHGIVVHGTLQFLVLFSLCFLCISCVYGDQRKHTEKRFVRQ